jgi:hypothetical protein
MVSTLCLTHRQPSWTNMPPIVTHTSSSLRKWLPVCLLLVEKGSARANFTRGIKGKTEKGRGHALVCAHRYHARPAASARAAPAHEE